MLFYSKSVKNAHFRIMQNNARVCIGRVINRQMKHTGGEIHRSKPATHA